MMELFNDTLEIGSMIAICLFLFANATDFNNWDDLI